MIKNNKINTNRKSLFAKRQGFTFIEILLIVAIIGILAVVIMVVGSQSGRDRAAINSYKTTMNSVKTAMELCGDGFRYFGDNISAGSSICTNGVNIRYPAIEKCGNISFNAYEVSAGSVTWIVEASECRGCKIACSIEGCVPIDGTEDQCR